MYRRMRMGLMRMVRTRRGSNSERTRMVPRTEWNHDASETAVFVDAVVRMDLNLVRELLERDKSLANIPMNMELFNCFALADIDEGSKYVLPSSPLHYAVKSSHTEMVNLLLRYDADVHAREKGGTGSTPLHFARTLEVALLLLDRGADPNGEDIGLGNMHIPPLRSALLRKDWEMAGVLIQRGAGINVAWGDDGRSSIHDAAGALWDELQVIEFLLDQGVDVNARTGKGKTPLHYVCHHGVGEMIFLSMEAARLLLRHGADVDATDYDGHTALFFACEYNRLDMAQLLIDKGADINLDGGSMLYSALTKNNLEALQFLLNNGIDVNCRAPAFGMITPLMFCMEQGHLESTAFLLLEHGADIHASNLQGETPFLLACEYQALELTFWMLRLSPHHQRPQPLLLVAS